jgi:hypothetical protein
MRIIKEGKKRVSSRRQTCPKCECVFEYEKKDLFYDQREPEPWVTCPCCRNFITVNHWKDYE